MIRNNKWKMIITSVIILLPVLAGMILWSELPEQIATHWNFEGNADGWTSRGMAVFGLPLILLAVQWICMFITSHDPRNKNRNQKVVSLTFWIVPVVSILGGAVIYLNALGVEFNQKKGAFALLGVLFIVIGNYLPKCSRNHTIGIKTPWTLSSEANWNATHRLGGWMWMIGGVVMLCGAFLPAAAHSWIVGMIIVIMLAVPAVYSYLFYKKHG